MKDNYSKLIQLLEINSYTNNKSGVEEKMNLILNWLRDLPLDWQEVESSKFGDFNYAKAPTKANLPQIGLVLHLDTVHNINDEVPINLSGNKLYGPGSQDMQASIYMIVELLYELHIEQKLYNLTIIFNTCEEKGSPEFQEISKKLAQSLDYLMVFESAASHKIYSADRFIITDSRKGTFQQVIETYGPGGHTGQLTQRAERVNAITQAIRMINEIQSLEDYSKESTVGILNINGGRENTVLAENCRFTFDVRYRYLTEYERITDSINKIVNTIYESGTITKDLGYKYNLPALPPNQNSKQFGELAIKVASEIGLDIKIEKRGGWSDACNYYKYNPNLKVLDGLGPQGGGEHTKNEFVYLDSINVMQRFSNRIIQKIQTK